MAAVRKLSQVTLWVFWVILPAPVLGAEEPLDAEQAQHLPLAPYSLLLDLVQVGDRIVAVGERGHVVHSDDQGQTWQQAEGVPTRSTLTSVFTTADRLWAAGHDSVIITSADGGNTWTRQYFDAERQQPVMDLHFDDARNGMAAGAYNLLLVTSDGGASWEDRPLEVEYDAHLNDILELDSGTVILAGEAGYSYRSIDGGETWEQMVLPYQGSMFGAVRRPNGCALLFGLRGHLMQSCDSGETWDELDTGIEATLLGAVTAGDAVIFVGNSGNVLTLHADGRFTHELHSSGVDFSAAIGIGPDRILIAGEEGTHWYPEAAPAAGKELE